MSANDACILDCDYGANSGNDTFIEGGNEIGLASPLMADFP